MFADDTKFYKTIAQPSDSTQLQNDINSLCRWSTESNLNFNHSKTIQLSFKSQIVSSTYTIGSSIIKIVDKHRDLAWNYTLLKPFLGATLPTHHLQGLQATGVEAFHLISPPIVKSNCIHFSHFMYCSVIWRPCLIKHIQLIERVQHRATKYILND